MATITSAQSGNFSATTTWVGGVVPGLLDDAVAATGHTVVIDTNVTVISVSQAGTGKFTLGNGRTLTANIVPNAGTWTSGGTVEVTATTSATINGNVTAPSISTNLNITGIVVSGSGVTLTINGNLTGTAANSSTQDHSALYVNVPATINVNGSVNGGAFRKTGIYSGAGASLLTLNIVGNVACFGQSAPGISLTSGGTVNITGNVIGSSGAFESGSAVSIGGGTATVSITGNVTAGNNNQRNNHGIFMTSGGSITVVGNVTGGASVVDTGNFGIYTTSGSVSVSVTGTVSAGAGINCHGIFSTGSSSLVSVIGTAIGASTLSHAIRCDATTNGVIFTGNLQDSTQGASAIYARIIRVGATNSGTTTYANAAGFPSGGFVSRVSPNNVTGMPATSNVRFGQVYGFNNELTGSLRVPPANAVASGVPVDNTTGTAALRPADIAGIVGAQIAAALTSPT